MMRAEAWLGVGAAVLLGIGTVVVGASADEGDATEIFAFTDPEITESSGLVVDDGLFVTVNDSGDAARVFTVDPATGDTVGVTTWDADAVDIEALAPAGGPDSGEVWVADTGDNLAQRASVSVTRVPVGRGDRAVPGETYELVYPDGAHDAETLLADPTTGRLYVVVKEFIGRVYAAPRRLDPEAPNELEAFGEPVMGISTDGSFTADGRHVVIRNYGQASVYTWPDLDRVDVFALPQQEQGEGLAVDARDRVFISSEGENQPVLRLRLPNDVRRALAGSAGTDDQGASAGPDESGDGEDAEGDLAGDDPPSQQVWWPWLIGGGVVAAIGLVVVGLRQRG